MTLTSIYIVKTRNILFPNDSNEYLHSKKHEIYYSQMTLTSIYIIKTRKPNKNKLKTEQ